MKKQKKISVKLIPLENNKGGYSVYCRATYNRKSTRFPIHHFFFVDSIDKAKESMDKVNNETYEESGDPLNYKKEWIERIIKYEALITGDEYSIIGLSERMNLYQLYMIQILVILSFDAVLNGLKSHVNYLKFQEVKKLTKGANSSSQYFELIDKLLELDTKILSKIIDKDVFNVISVAASFIAFELFRPGVKLYPPLKENDVPNIVGTTTFGQWVINEYDSKLKFENYLKTNNPFKEPSKIIKTFTMLCKKLNFKRLDKKELLKTTNLIMDEIVKDSEGFENVG